jgi:uroporphyrinogen III methyltransferase/synthase
MASLLHSLGADVIEAPSVEIRPVADLSPVDHALQNVTDYDWLVLTSVNGVEATINRMQELGINVTILHNLKLAAIGPATADRLRDFSLEAQVMPDEFVAESLADAIGTEEIQGQRFLMLRSNIARSMLPEVLTEMGAICDDVPAYQTAAPDALPPETLEALRTTRIDWITFTSSSTFRNFRILLGDDADRVLTSAKLASIGPVTSNTMRNAGFDPTIEAPEHTIEGLVTAIRDHVIGSP